MFHSASKLILLTLALSFSLPSLGRPSPASAPARRSPNRMARRSISRRYGYGGGASEAAAPQPSTVPEGTKELATRPKLEPSDLIAGNQRFVQKIEASDPGLLKNLADEGQTPDFMFLGCSDSRVSEANIFDTKPGTFFTERNIANQFSPSDINSHAVLSYGVTVLGVRHVIVLGHYGCGGVAASIASAPPNGIDAASSSVQTWISPIRALYESSSRPEIVALRERNANLTASTGALIEEPEIEEPGFRALVEENVKLQVSRIASDSVIKNHYADFAAFKAGNVTEKRSNAYGKRSEGPSEPQEVFIHGWVYDISTGGLTDLKVTVSPPGAPAEPAPSSAVDEALRQSSTSAAAPVPTASAEASGGGGVVVPGGIVNVRRSAPSRHYHVHRDGSVHAH